MKGVNGHIAVGAVLLALGGCTTNSDRIHEVGGRIFTEAETGSVLVLDGAIRYTCVTARIGAVTARFNTPELREAWAVMCAAKPAIPTTPETLEPLPE